MKDSKKGKEPLCPKCISWDPRPEDGQAMRSGYCIARDIVTSYRYECDYYEESTEKLREKRKIELYGQFNEEHDHEH